MTEIEERDPWLEMAKEAYDTSTTYMDTNYRKQWENNQRHFQSKHGTGSKYLKAAYRYRSKIFRPKTRSAVRNKEAAGMAAFFANQDVVNCEPMNQNDDYQRASAEINQELLGYRLDKSIKWFLTCIGALQETMVAGITCSCQEWEYEEKPQKTKVVVINEDGEEVEEEQTTNVIKKDNPVIRLIPPENLRFSPNASWLDPVNTSPYFIELMPMYAKDVKQRMKVGDSKTGEPKWKELEDDEILAASKIRFDSTRMTREAGRTDRIDEQHSKKLQMFDIVWVHRNFMEHEGQDYVYYTLGTEHMLSKPKPIEEIYFHGIRPYVIGVSSIEAHKLIPDSIAQIGANIQKEINENANQRHDNIKFALNKRWLVRRGQQVDLKSIVRNVAGSVTMVNDIEKDVKEVEFRDVTAGSFNEQDRLNLDFDELIGTFSASTIQSNRKMNETVGGMNMLRSNVNMLTEYDLRVFAETWVEPTLCQFVKLEQAYETDEVILALAAEKAQLYQKYGIDQVTDDLLNQELTVRVNVGMGATDPIMKMRNFAVGLEIILKVLTGIPPGSPIDVIEVIKEVFGYLGHKDGARFLVDQLEQDPEKMQMAQIIEQLQGMLQQLQMQLESKERETQAKVAMTDMKERGQDRRKAAELKTRLTEKQMDLLNPVVGKRLMPPLDDEGLAMVRNTLDLGDEAREFLNSHLGEYLLATAQEIIDANLKLLKDVNPYEIETVRKYQNNIRVAENSIQWIVDAIQSANEILDQEEAEDDLEVEN